MREIHKCVKCGQEFKNIEDGIGPRKQRFPKQTLFQRCLDCRGEQSERVHETGLDVLAYIRGSLHGHYGQKLVDGFELLEGGLN